MAPPPASNPTIAVATTANRMAMSATELEDRALGGAPDAETEVLGLGTGAEGVDTEAAGA